MSKLGSSSQTRPLAGRPPFATDEDDSIYDRPAPPRAGRTKPENPNARTSAYNTYDQYFDEGDGKNDHNRDSTGAFGVGMGLLGEVSDSDDEEEVVAPSRTAPPGPTGKNRALYEAATRAEPSSAATVNTVRTTPDKAALPPTSQPSANSLQDLCLARSSPAPQAQIPSRSAPGLPNGASSPTRPDLNGPLGPDPGRRPDGHRPPGLTIPPAAQYQSRSQVDSSPRYPPTPQSRHDSPSPSPHDVPPRTAARSPMPAPIAQHAPTSVARPMPVFMMPSSPAPPPSPGLPGSPAPPYAHTPPAMPRSPMSVMQPLELPPSTPITPLFAAPPTPEASKAKVSFKDDCLAPPIIRGGSEDTLLDRTKGEYLGESTGSEESATTVGSGPRRKLNDGDAFWRRFSMVAHQGEDRRSPYGGAQSSWLAKTQARTRAYSRWVWVFGVILLLCIGGAIGAGVYFDKDGAGGSGGAPEAIGGKASESDITTTPSTSTKSSANSTGYHVQTLITSDGSVIAMPTGAKNIVLEVPAAITSAPTSIPTPASRSHHRKRQHLNLNRQLFT